MEQIDYKFIDQVLADHACDASQIIAIMQDVQGKYRYLPKDALRYIADKVGISESKIYGVATFYENFSLDVKGKYVLKVCRGTACHVRKSGNVLQAIYDAIQNAYAKKGVPSCIVLDTCKGKGATFAEPKHDHSSQPSEEQWAEAIAASEKALKAIENA